MPVNKVVPSFESAVADIPDGATILFGGFGGPGGFPTYLTWALFRQGARNLTVVSNNLGDIGLAADFVDLRVLFLGRRVKKGIATFPAARSPSHINPFELLYRAGEVELEVVPQGTLAERLRCAGAGIPAFYTPTGAGTLIAQGKETRVFDGREHLLEYALKADYAFVRAYKADPRGNLVYQGTSRQFNPLMAMAAKVTIAEVDEVVPLGGLDPECVVTPGIFVHRVVRIPPEEPRFLTITPEIQELDRRLREEQSKL